MSRTFLRTSSESLTYASVAGSLIQGGGIAGKSFSCWLNPVSLANYDRYVEIGWTYFGAYNGYFIAGQSNGTLDAGHAWGGNYYPATIATILQTGVWQHLALVITRSGITCTSKAFHSYGGTTTTATGSSSNLPITSGTTGIGTRIGRGYYGDYTDGSIAEVAIWDTPLTDADVAMLAVGYNPLMVQAGSLAMYMPLVRDNDDDLIGGLQFTANNTPTVSAHPRVLYPARVHDMGLYETTPAQVIASAVPSSYTWLPVPFGYF